ncbi:PKD domain-containing protein [Candidatus Woesearchaeota archaeon]|nr:PKD domain-containing protein [Candidatus Woesearchaeota archaeon]
MTYGCILDSDGFIDCVTQPDQNGFSDVTVSATDEGGLTTWDTFRINVLSVDDGPTVNIIEPGSEVTEEVEFDFVATASDPEGDALTFILDFGDGTVETGNVINGMIETTHTYAEEGTYTITVTVSDGSLTATDSKIVEATESTTSDVRNIVYIGGIAFDNEFPKPGDELNVFVRFENQGDEDLKDARLTAIIQDLGIRSSTVKAEVNDGQEASKVLTLEIPEDAQAGRYWVEVIIDIDGNRRIKYRPIDII